MTSLPTYPMVVRREKATGDLAIFMQDGAYRYDSLTCFTFQDGHTSASWGYFLKNTIPVPWSEGMQMWNAYLKEPGEITHAIPRLYKRFPSRGYLTYNQKAKGE